MYKQISSKMHINTLSSTPQTLKTFPLCINLHTRIFTLIFCFHTNPWTSFWRSLSRRTTSSTFMNYITNNLFFFRLFKAVTLSVYAFVTSLFPDKANYSNLFAGYTLPALYQKKLLSECCKSTAAAIHTRGQTCTLPILCYPSLSIHFAATAL